MLVESKKQSSGNTHFSEHFQADSALIAGTQCAIPPPLNWKFVDFIDLLLTISQLYYVAAKASSLSTSSGPAGSSTRAAAGQTPFGKEQFVNFLSFPLSFSDSAPFLISNMYFDDLANSVVVLSERLPPGLPDIVEERLASLEHRVYSNISSTSRCHAHSRSILIWLDSGAILLTPLNFLSFDCLQFDQCLATCMAV